MCSLEESERVGKNRRLAIIYLLVFVAIVALVIAFWPRGEKVEPPSYSEVVAMVERGEVSRVEIVDGRGLVVIQTDDTKFKSSIYSESVDEFTELATTYGVDVKFKYSSGFNW